MRENIMWYRKPAGCWDEALPLGNGRLGMMVYGGVSEEQVQLNEETIWSGWQFDGYDDPKTLEYLPQVRELIFQGKYSDAQALCNKYLVCRGGGHHDYKSGAFGSYQTAGDLYLTFPEAIEGDYRRQLNLDEGYATVTQKDALREYFISYNYNTAVIRLSGKAKDAELRYDVFPIQVDDKENMRWIDDSIPR